MWTAWTSMYVVKEISRASMFNHGQHQTGSLNGGGGGKGLHYNLGLECGYVPGVEKGVTWVDGDRVY